MQRIAIFSYGIVSYAIFFICFLYAIGFVGNIWVPISIDSAPTTSLPMAIAINLGLLTLFAVQHSGMARPAFKRWFTQYIPASVERSTYVLTSTICMALLMFYWAPMGGSVWQVETPWAVTLLNALYLASWGLLLYATFLIDHFDLFGLRQVWGKLTNKPDHEHQFVTPTLYRFVRHPIYVGWLGIFWFTPMMSVTHLMLAVGTTLYILVAIGWEEKDLEAAHPEYAQYKRKVPALIPSFKRRLSRREQVEIA